ncbi:histidinol-phosphatase (PHP family) [Terribacillus aidingensis]|uniref:Histidinol-phosphatase n=1 Tax=Terribacillus aidingensis TaxID=586416 RepID=A0A285NQI4_9BACI|nr:histidinol-phosphatase HisJ [Terribacillus aidingensis]SNZ10126.1 histidinol-phosphatase (PHP family) [Terribacillus aidingensis]
MIGDFHVHTHYCQHGSADNMEAYVLQALAKGLTHLSFTEHAPLPESFSDPAPQKDSTMDRDKVEAYLKEGQALQKQYAQDLQINIGFEVDYIQGYEHATKQFLDMYGAETDDSILSVHMLQAPDKSFFCIDFSEEEFGRAAKAFGGLTLLYKAYYDSLQASVEAELGRFKPKRIGHITLIQKFQLAFPQPADFWPEQRQLLALMKKNGYELDVNTAGLYKPLCKEIYPSAQLIQHAVALGIPLVPGSDSHAAAGIGKGFEKLQAFPLRVPQTQISK